MGKENVFDPVLRVAVDQNAVFARGSDVEKADVFDVPALRFGVAVEGREDDRLRRAPPVGAEAARFDDDVLIADVFNVAAVANLDRQRAVGAADDTV